MISAMITMLKIVMMGVAGIMLSAILSACNANMPEAGFVCTTDCHHECPDGPSGEQCRAQKKAENNEDGPD